MTDRRRHPCLALLFERVIAALALRIIAVLQFFSFLIQEPNSIRHPSILPPRCSLVSISRLSFLENSATCLCYLDYYGTGSYSNMTSVRLFDSGLIFPIPNFRAQLLLHSRHVLLGLLAQPLPDPMLFLYYIFSQHPGLQIRTQLSAIRLQVRL